MLKNNLQHRVGKPIIKKELLSKKEKGDNKPTGDWEKEKLNFEANMLDGDKVEDCGGAMLSAEDVWRFIKELLSTERGEIMEWAKKNIIDEVKRTKVLKRGGYYEEINEMVGYNDALNDLLDFLTEYKLKEKV